MLYLFLLIVSVISPLTAFLIYICFFYIYSSISFISIFCPVIHDFLLVFSFFCFCSHLLLPFIIAFCPVPDVYYIHLNHISLLSRYHFLSRSHIPPSYVWNHIFLLYLTPLPPVSPCLFIFRVTCSSPDGVS